MHNDNLIADQVLEPQQDLTTIALVIKMPKIEQVAAQFMGIANTKYAGFELINFSIVPMYEVEVNPTVLLEGKPRGEWVFNGVFIMKKK